MSDRLQEIRARLDAATPGPWDWSDHINCCWEAYVYPASDDDKTHVCEVNNRHGRDDAHFIAHAPTDIAWLLDEVERWRAFAEAVGRGDA